MLKRLFALMIFAALAAPGQFATFPDKTYFREQWQRAPLGMEIETVGNLEDFHYDEKLELSLRAFLELAMANNPDINLQKLAILEQQNNIQRAYSPFDPNVRFSFNSNRATTPSADQLEGAAVRTRLDQNPPAASGPRQWQWQHGLEQRRRRGYPRRRDAGPGGRHHGIPIRLI